MKTLKESPILQSLTRTDKKKFWVMRAYTEDGSCFYAKSYWQESLDGVKSKVQTSVPVEVFGKNIGRANETTPEEQLISEFDSRVKKQRDKGYSEDGSMDHIPTKPMLANKYKDKKHKVVFPCFVQPKFNGFRMLKEGDGTEAWTRGGKPHAEACVTHLMWDTGKVMVDGELMMPDAKTLQDTSKYAKKFYPGFSENLSYYVYDVVIPDFSFAERYEVLKEMVRNAPERIKIVETVEVHNEDELFACHADFVARGYEGTIIRSGPDGYNVGHRSNSLLKLKNSEDAEFRVIDVEDGKGSFEGKAICICVTADGYKFNAVPEGPMSHRAEIFENKENYIGKWLTVRYYETTESGSPFHGVGVDFREEGEF